MTFAKFWRTVTLKNTCERLHKKEWLIKPKVKINSQIVDFIKIATPTQAIPVNFAKEF